jgi:hypothetical protein
MERNRIQPARPQPEQADDAQEEREHDTHEHDTNPGAVSTHESPGATPLSNAEAGLLQPVLENLWLDPVTQAAAIWLRHNRNGMQQEQADGVPDWIRPEGEESQFDDAEYASDDETVLDSAVSGEIEGLIRELGILNTDVRLEA